MAEINSRKLCAIVADKAVRVLLWPFWWLCRRMLYDSTAFDKYHGIIIAEFGAERDLDPCFVLRTKEALDYIRDIDSPRFTRIRKNLKAIVKSRAGSSFGGKYQHHVGACVVNYDVFPYAKNPEEAKKQYSCILVHEATHGLLANMGIVNCIVMNSDARRREEHLCVMEEIRLSRKFNDGHRDEWERVLDEKNRYI